MIGTMHDKPGTYVFRCQRCGVEMRRDEVVDAVRSRLLAIGISMARLPDGDGLLHDCYGGAFGQVGIMRLVGADIKEDRDDAK